MILTDVHTHTTFSFDAKDDINTMLAHAEKTGVSYYGIAEHFDYDYLANGLSFGSAPAQFIDAESYFKTARSLQKSCKLKLLVGAEFGYCDDNTAIEKYIRAAEEYSPDFIVNSVHSTKKGDYYFGDPFIGKEKAAAYGEYFELVLKSLDAPYPYDIVGHLGYCSRYAPYPDKKIRYCDFPKEIDAILLKIIEKDKILEVNSSANGALSEFLPDKDVLRRYFELGGRNISFASDAHFKERICDKRKEIVSALKEIGFTYLTVPFVGEKIKVEI